MSTRSIACARIACAIVIATIVAPGRSAAQDPCDLVTVSPANPVAGQPFEICGPSGAQYYHSWRNAPADPTPFSTSRCVSFPSGLPAGTYTWEHTYSVDANSNGPDATDPHYKCLVEVTVASAPGGLVCDGGTIAPDDTVCVGTAMELCAPTGDGYYYSWRDENETLLSTSRCVTVSRSAGCYEYELTISDDLTGNGPSQDDPFVTCPIVVCFEACDGDVDVDNCPRSPGFWKQQCRQRGNGSTKFTRDQMDQITARIDDRSDLFSWDGDFDSFCDHFDKSAPKDVRARALRDFLVVLANHAVGDLGLVARNGAEVRLDLDTPITCDGEATTIGALIELADARFAVLAGMSLDDRAVRDEYAAFAECFDDINHGVGIGETCCAGRDDDDDENGDDDGDGDDHGDDGDDEDDEDCEDDGKKDDDDDEDDDKDDDVARIRIAPNPLVRATLVAYTVREQVAPVEITVHDIAGRQLRRLVGQSQPAGYYEVGWDGTNDEGVAVRSGVYFVRGRIGSERILGRILVVR